MVEQHHLFIQKINHVRTDTDLDLAFLLEITFVETMDLSGPRLMAEFDDPVSWFKDTVGMKEGDKLRLTISDLFIRDGIDEVIDFTIVTMPVKGNSVKINAFATAILDVKTRVSGAMLFNKRSASYMLGRLFPGFKQDINKFPVVEDYHILAGERPSFVLKQIGLEKGGHIFLKRDTICMLMLSDLMAKKTPDFTYYSDNEGEDNQVISFSIPSSDHFLNDKIVRKYSGWNITDGWVSYGGDSIPPKITANQSKITLKNIRKSIKPILDFTCMGNGYLKAGSVLDFVWRKNLRMEPIDESLPSRAIAYTVSHKYRANKYFCRVKACVPLEG